jgi:uncharacterized membrane protein (DUF485 family)
MIRFYQCFALVSLAIAAISAIFCVGFRGSELKLLPLLPIFYLLTVALLLGVTWSTGPSLFLSVCLPIVFFRYVAFPVLIAFNGGYEGRSSSPPSEESYSFAIILMVYELMLVTLLVAFLERRYHRNKREHEFKAHSLPMWYVIVVVIFCVTLAFVFPESFLLINMLKPTIVADDVDISSTATFAAMSVVIAKVFLFLSLLRKLAQSSRWRIFAPWGAVFLCLLNVVIYFGTNRMAMVLTAIASILMLHKLFGTRSNIPIAIIVVSAVFMFVLVTKQREYVSYSNSRLASVADTIQVYTGGIYNVAIGVEVKSRYPEATKLSVLAYDFLRPTIGINLLVRDWNIFYSNIYFNYRMWIHLDRRSQIMPMIAQGYLFFPLLLAPLLSLFFVCLAYVLLHFINRVRYMEFQFALALVVMRLGLFWGQNTMNMMNYISINLILPFLLIIFYLVLRKSLRPGYGVAV